VFERAAPGLRLNWLASLEMRCRGEWLS